MKHYHIETPRQIFDFDFRSAWDMKDRETAEKQAHVEFVLKYIEKYPRKEGEDEKVMEFLESNGVTITHI